MGRAKVVIKRIENKTSQQVTYSKRKNGLIKKAYELSVLCDIDIALIMFSPAGRLTHFSSPSKSALIPPLEGEDKYFSMTARQYMKCIFDQNMRDNEISHFLPSQAAAFRSKIEEINLLHNQLQMVKDQLSYFEPDLEKIKSLKELELCEKRLRSTLAIVKERQKHLITNHPAFYDSPCFQEMSNSFENGVASWGRNPPEIFDDPPPSSVLLWDNVSATYDQFSQGSSSGIGGYPSNTPSDEYLSKWPHVYPSTDLADHST